MRIVNALCIGLRQTRRAQKIGDSGINLGTPIFLEWGINLNDREFNTCRKVACDRRTVYVFPCFVATTPGSITHLSCRNTGLMPRGLASSQILISLRSSSTSYSIFPKICFALNICRSVITRSGKVRRGVCVAVYKGMCKTASDSCEVV